MVKDPTWFEQVSAQYAGGLLVAITIAIFLAGVGIVTWAYLTLPGPTFALIALEAFVLVLVLLLHVLWHFDTTRRHPSDPAREASHERERDDLRDAIAARDAQILELQRNADLFRQEGSRLAAQLAELTVERDALINQRKTSQRDHEIALVRRRQQLEETEEERGRLSVELSNLKTRLDSLAIPSWLEKAVKQDSDDLRSAIAFIDEQSQNYHVLFDLDNKHEPSILFHFMLLNTSVYTVEITAVEGLLQIEHEVIPGRFRIDEAQVPVIFARRRRYNLFLRFVIETEASRGVMKELVAQGQKIHCNLDNVRLRMQAREDPSVVAELRFAQQWWQPSEQPPGYN